MSLQNKAVARQEAIGLVIMVVIVIGLVGTSVVISPRPVIYHYEARLPNSDHQNTRFTITGIEDANITISFVNEPGLWFRLDLAHYSSEKRHSLENVTEPSFLPPRAHLTSITPVKTINIEFGTDVAHSISISGENLNTLITLGNGAKISGGKFRYYSSGKFSFIMTEDVNFTSVGMNVEVGDLFLSTTSPNLVILDIDLPEGLNGHLSTPNATFLHNEWPVNYGKEWGTSSIIEPLLNIEIYFSMRVWANLRI